METNSPNPLMISQAGYPIPQALPLQSLPMGAPPQEGGDLKQWISMLRRRVWVVAGVAIVVAGAMIGRTMLENPVYESRFQILVEPVNNDGRDVAELTTQSSNNNQSALDYATQIQVLRSPTLLNGTIKKLQATYPDLNYGSLIQGLTVSQLGKTKILEIRYQNSDPSKVQAVLEQLSKDYLEYSLKTRQTNLRQGIQFVQDQLPASQAQVSRLQNAIQLLRQQYNFNDPDSYASQLTQQSSTLKEQLQTLNQKLTEVKAGYSGLQEEAGAVAALNNAGTYQQLVGELRKVETEIASELTRFRSGSLKIRILREKQANLAPLLRQEAERVVGGKLAEAANQIQTLEVQRQSLLTAQAELDRFSRELPVISRRYTNLQQELQSATESRNRFLAARETLQIEAAQKEVPWQLIGPPGGAPIQISPDIRKGILLGIGLGLAAGVGAALLLEKMDNVYYTAEELKRKTKLPLLGIIPWHKQLKDIQADSLALPDQTLKMADPVIDVTPNRSPSVFLSQSSPGQVYSSSKFLDALRVLHTNIQLSNSNRTIRSFVISSAVPGDGKSTVALYLAQTAAEMGMRVLFVDADLRRSQLHTRLKLSHQKGLSNLLTEKISLKEVIQKPLPIDNLWVLASGQIPYDPTQLLASFKMQQLMEFCHRTFDLVIYDAPPILGLADTNVLAPRTNGMILVTRLGKTERSLVAQAMDNLKMAQIPILGIVANGS